MTFPHQTPKHPKPIKTFTKLTTPDLNIKTRSLCHSIKNESPLTWSLATHIANIICDDKVGARYVSLKG